jgi:hypothetical protein
MKNLFLKIVLIFIVSLIGSWMFSSIFSQLFNLIHFSGMYGGIFLIPENFYIEGFLIAYPLIANLLIFIFLEKKQWLSWFIINLPIIIFLFGIFIWQIFIWYIVMTILGYVLGRVIRVIVKRVK